MKLRKSYFDYISVIKYLVCFVFFLIFAKLESQVNVYSVAVFVTAMAEGANPVITPILYICSFLVFGEVGLLAQAVFPAVLMIVLVLIYKKFNTPLRAEITAYTAISMLGFIFLGNTAKDIELEKRLLSVLLSTVLTFICYVSASGITKKGLKFKLGYEEFATLIITTALTGLGVSNLVSPLLWKTISVIIILTVAFLFRTGICTLISAIFGISLALYYNDLNYVALYLLWGIACESLMPLSRYLSAIGIVVMDYLVQLIFGIYGSYSVMELVFIITGATVFSIFPTKILTNIKEKLYAFREKQLVRQTINRNRLMLSNRLYELSGVFTEMANAFSIFKKNKLSEESAKIAVMKEIQSTVCKECECFDRCKKLGQPSEPELNKLLDIGFAKGRLSLIDFPKKLGEVCLHPNNVIYATNKLLASYRTYLIDNMNLSNGRDLIAAEAVGVAEILRGLALESGSQLKYQSRAERLLGENLFKNGFTVTEILIYGDEDNLSVGLIVAMKEFVLQTLTAVISTTLGQNMCLFEKFDITDGKCYLSFKKSAEFDAVFGIAHSVKDGSEKSGDTHSVTRIRDDKFLVALSDGMGSGKDAETVSSASLTLIESFYKAGLSSPLILNTVNKLLAINTEDSFTALDISVIDLKTCTADFIKYGSPYGFIIGDGGIRIIEGNSLPLGILDELNPSVCSHNLDDGDMLLFVTDGVSDAFGSSSEVIEYLRSVPAKNPQTLADGILEHATHLTGGKKADDMTALAVRIFKRTA